MPTLQVLSGFDFSDEGLALARGLWVPQSGSTKGAERKEKTGVVTAAATGDDLWGGSAAYNWQTTAQSLEIVSSDADDDGAPTTNTGAQTVRVYGLSSTYAEQSELVTLNGITAVALVNTYIAINRIEVVTAGTSGVNEGALTLRLASAGATVGVVPALYSVDQDCVYTVPADREVYITFWNANTTAASGAGNGVVALQIRDTQTTRAAWQTLQTRTIVNGVKVGGEVLAPQGGRIPFYVPEKYEIRLHVLNASASLAVEGEFEFVQIKRSAATT